MAVSIHLEALEDLHVVHAEGAAEELDHQYAKTDRSHAESARR